LPVLKKKLTTNLRKGYEKVKRKTQEHRILIVDKSKHRVKWRYHRVCRVVSEIAKIGIRAPLQRERQ